MIPTPVKRALAAKYAKSFLQFFKKKAYSIDTPLPLSAYTDYYVAHSDCPISDTHACLLEEKTKECLEPPYIKTVLQCDADISLNIVEQPTADVFSLLFTNEQDNSLRAVFQPKTDKVEQHMSYVLKVQSSLSGITHTHQVKQAFKVAHRFRFPKGAFRIPYIVIRALNFTQDEFTFTFKSPGPFFSPNPSCPACVFVDDFHLQLDHPNALNAIRDIIINQFKYYGIPSTAYDFDVVDLKDAIGVDFYVKHIPAGVYAGGIRAARNLPSGFSELINEPEKLVKPFSYIPFKSLALPGGCNLINVEIQPFEFTLPVTSSTLFDLNMPVIFSDNTASLSYILNACTTKQICYTASDDVVRVESFYGFTKLFSSTKKQDCFTIPYGLFGTHVVKAVNSTHCTKEYTIVYNDPTGEPE